MMTEVPADSRPIETYFKITGSEIKCGETTEVSCPSTVTLLLPDRSEVICDLDCPGQEPNPYTNTCECDLILTSCEWSAHSFAPSQKRKGRTPP